MNFETGSRARFVITVRIPFLGRDLFDVHIYILYFWVLSEKRSVRFFFAYYLLRASRVVGRNQNKITILKRIFRIHVTSLLRENVQKCILKNTQKLDRKDSAII